MLPPIPGDYVERFGDTPSTGEQTLTERVTDLLKSFEGRPNTSKTRDEIAAAVRYLLTKHQGGEPPDVRVLYHCDDPVRVWVTDADEAERLDQNPLSPWKLL